MAEKRAYPRVKAFYPVLYSSHVYPRPKVGSTVDLSRGGVRIETPFSLIPGETIEISIALTPQVIRCRGRVVSTSSLEGGRPSAGVEFEDISKHDGLYLGEYISYLMHEEESETG